LHTLVVHLPGQPLPEGLETNIRPCSVYDLLGPEAVRLFLRFNIFELANSLKAPLLTHLLDRPGAEQAVYVDSDIRFYHSPEPLFRRLVEHDLLLNPNLADPSESLSTDWETEHLNYGTYNGGMVGVRNSENARRILAWWGERCLRYCCADPELGVFSDQRWLDLVPGLFANVCVERSPAQNVAVWNVPGRPIHYQDGCFQVREQPMMFFHFHKAHPGIDPERYFWQDAGLAAVQLVREYIEALQAKGYAQHTQTAEYRPHDRFAGGDTMPPLFFRVLRDTLNGSDADLGTGQLPADFIRRRLTDDGPARTRLRVMAYARSRLAEATDVDRAVARYQKDRWFRWRVDWWFYWFAPRFLKMPIDWCEPRPLRRRLRGCLTALARKLGSWRS
jgi:hypothetical protein